jgi:MFS family permease
MSVAANFRLRPKCQLDLASRANSQSRPTTRRSALVPNQSFNRFVAASGLTNLADGIAVVAWAWMASLLTRDLFLIALMPVALRLPWFVFAIPAGIITDRVDRRKLIIWMDVIRAIAFAIATVVIWNALPLSSPSRTEINQPTVFYTMMGAALLVGVAEVFRDNAAQTMLPSLVPHDALERANGKLWSVELIGNSLIGPALGAFLISAFSPAPFVLNSAFYTVSLVCVMSLKGTFQPQVAKRKANWPAELGEAYNFLKSSPLLRALALLTGGWNLVFQMSTIALVLHVQENLNLGATAYGLLLAAGAFGGICAGYVAERIIKRFGPMRTAQVSLMVSAPGFLMMAAAPNWFTLAFTLAIFEFAGLTWNTVSVSYRQRKIPNAMLGRVNSLYRLLAWGFMPIGLILSGLIVRFAEPIIGRSQALNLPIFTASAGALVLGIYGWQALDRGFSRADLDQPAPRP